MWNKSIFKLSTYIFITVILLGVLYFKLATISLSNYSRFKPIYKLSSYNISDEDDWIQTIDGVMKKRRNHLAKTCKLIKRNFEKEGPTKMFFAEKYHLGYCSVPKTGCSNFKKILWLLNERVSNINDISKYANSTTFHEITRKFFQKPNWQGLPEFARNYTKFIIVRHPFERLVSAYYNKLVPKYPKKVPQFAELAKLIKSTYGSTNEKEDLANSYPSFEEFVDYVTNEIFQNNRIDDHFRNFVPLCWPCAIDYEIIAHTETLNNDIKYLLKKLKAPDEYNQLQKGYSKDGNRLTTSEKSLKEFWKIPRHKIYRLYMAYRNDFLLFNYDASPYFMYKPT